MSCPGDIRGRWAALTAAIAVGLVLNVFTLAPAFHEHSKVHNDHDCLICDIQANGAWTVATSPDTPEVLLRGDRYATPPEAGYDDWTALPDSCRGPPGRALTS